MIRKRLYLATNLFNIWLIVYDPNYENIIMYIATSERRANVKKAEISRTLNLKHNEKSIIKVVKMQLNRMLYDPECLPKKETMLIRSVFGDTVTYKHEINLSKK